MNDAACVSTNSGGPACQKAQGRAGRLGTGKGVDVIDPRETYKSAEVHARHAQRTGMRLLFSGIGFSAAYFLDPQHGASRRKQAVGYIRRGRQAIATARAGDGGGNSPRSGPVERAPQFAENGLKVAR
jgi:hypothetical protein